MLYLLFVYITTIYANATASPPKCGVCPRRLHPTVQVVRLGVNVIVIGCWSQCVSPVIGWWPGDLSKVYPVPYITTLTRTLTTLVRLSCTAYSARGSLNLSILVTSNFPKNSISPNPHPAAFLFCSWKGKIVQGLIKSVPHHWRKSRHFEMRRLVRMFKSLLYNQSWLLE